MRHRSLKGFLAIILFSIPLFVAFGCETATDSVKANGSEFPIGTYEGDTAEGGDCVWVEPYFRTDGTCVRGHWRSAPGRDCTLVGKVYKPCP